MRFRVPILRNPELQANFEQLEETIPGVISIGSGELEWPGGSSATGTVTIKGLPPGTARFTVATASNAIAQVVFVSTTSFQVYARTGDGSSPAKGVKVAYQYISIGQQ